MKKLLSLLIVTLSANVIANEQWPPANEPPERAAIFMEKTYEKPENVKKGVTLFISGWNKQKKLGMSHFIMVKSKILRKISV
ncbi:hypothetical protein [Pasteurella multocida]|uniref:hypothetical protein n=1 Tax=Pasteurella multocida TaxID=747 RepID=UPI0014811715|nr:hypothetical protein [Pasteurella multocida]